MSPEENGAKARYEIVLSPQARRALSERLPSSVVFAAWEFIDNQLRGNPRKHGHPLTVPHEGRWSASRGPYRIIYRIDDVVGTVNVLDIALHRDAYRAP